jgi:uncharacterized caspase-like protein
LRRVLGIALLALVIPVGAVAQQQRPAEGAEARIALVVGNANYKDSPLANPVHDARAVAKALDGLGFKVSLKVNLTQTQLRRAIREFGDALHATQGVGLFYFAGHGVQISNRNFLIPVGSDIQREYEVEEQAVDAGTVLAMMQSARARVNIVILDACRNNPFIRDFRSNVNGLAPMQAPAGTFIAFSTAPGQTAIDGTGQLGLYTEHLVENITLPGLKIEDVFKNVRVGVQRASSGKQIPWENTSLTGDFYFNRSPAEAAPVPAGVAVAAPAAASQDEIERAVMAALRKREAELSDVRAARAERDAAMRSVENLKKELAELRAAQRRGAAGEAAAPSRPSQLALAAPRGERTVTPGARVNRPEIRVGDRWRYLVTDRYTDLKQSAVIEATAITENRIYTRNLQVAAGQAVPAGGAIAVWDRSWNQLRHGDMEYAPYYPSFQFPLETGKSWSGNVTYTVDSGETVAHELKMQVVGWERVTVPAGTFDCMKITMTGHFVVRAAIGTGTGTVNDAAWYAPSIGQVVMRDIHQRSHYSPPVVRVVLNRHNRYERWELVEYRH